MAKRLRVQPCAGRGQRRINMTLKADLGVEDRLTMAHDVDHRDFNLRRWPGGRYLNYHQLDVDIAPRRLGLRAEPAGFFHQFLRLGLVQGRRTKRQG